MPVSHNNEPTQPNASHLTRRGKAALFLSGVAAGTLIHPATSAIDGFVNKAKSNVEQADESGYYSQRNLFEKMQQSGGFDSSKVEVRPVAPGDYPELMATEMGAKDPTLVANEISAQEGGERNLHAGDNVVIPKDQLEQPESEDK